MNKESQKGKFLWFIVILAVIALVINTKFVSWSLPTSGVTAPQIQPANPQPPRTYTRDIVMMTETTNVAIPFGYHLDVNWGYAPIHVVTNDLQVTATSPGHTEYGIGQGFMFKFDSGYEVSPVKLHCTYTELR